MKGGGEPAMPSLSSAEMRALFAEHTLTPLAASLVEWASVLATRKRDRNYEVSCTGIFLAAATMMKEGHVLVDVSADRAELRRFTRYHLRNIEPHRHQLERLIREYYVTESLPTNVREKKEARRVVPSESLRLAVESWLPPIIGAMDLLYSVLHYRSAALQGRLRRIDISPGSLLPYPVGDDDDAVTPVADDARRPTNESTPAAEPARPDLRTHIDRDPDDPAQLSSSVDVYATTLATIFRTAIGEFCFGLFGPWGIGKTRLVRRLTPLLEDPKQYEMAMAARGYRVEGDDFDQLHYKVVWYSAWKYRRPPESWVFLYQSIARPAMHAKLREKFRLAVQTGVARRGYWLLMLDMLLLGLFVVPVREPLWQVFAIGVSALGLGGLIVGSGTAERGLEAVHAFTARYATLGRHAERLGPQALVGDDLRALLVSWIPSPREHTFVAHDAEAPADRVSNGALGLSLIGLAAFAALWLWRMMAVPSADALLYAAGFAVWGSLVVLVFAVLRAAADGPDRVLLVVDDLDRCSPSEVIEIAEAVKLLLEDDEIEKRVQVVMLVDEDILKNAILTKFSELIKKESGDFTAEGIVQEHVEKLFACHLRLPALTPEEVSDLMERFVARVPEPEAQEGEPSTPRPQLPRENKAPKHIRGEGAAFTGETSTTQEMPKLSGSALRFVDSEIALLREQVAKCLSQSGRRASPRAIRLFLFKYQLCRLLLQLSRSAASEPREIIEALSGSEENAALARIVRQVA
ncbi:MAG TPA: P-loop NTPase fold protein [Rhizomicrobium sp.]|jgi:hypothetical protein